MFDCKIETQKLGIKKDTKDREEVAAVIDVRGSYKLEKEKKVFEGLMVFMTPMDTYLSLSENLLGEKFTDINEDNEDVGAEICNMIVGNARSELGKLGYSIALAIPKMSVGKLKKIPYIGDAPIFMLPIITKVGNFSIEFCYKLKEKKKNMAER